MSPRCFQSSFSSTQLTVWEMSFDELQDGHHGGHIGYRNATILAILNLIAALMPSTKFRLTSRAQVLFEELQDCGHLGYLNGTVLVILNLHLKKNINTFGLKKSILSTGMQTEQSLKSLTMGKRQIITHKLNKALN